MAKAGSPIHQILAQKADINPPYYPCADDYTQTYMNVSLIRSIDLKNLRTPR